PSTSGLYPLSLHDALPISTRTVSEAEATDLVHGRRITASDSTELFAAHLDNGKVIALITDAERAGKIESKPEIVFSTMEDITGADRKSTRLNSSHVSISYA